MNSQKTLVVLVVILAAGLVFETAYMLGARQGTLVRDPGLRAAPPSQPGAQPVAPALTRRPGLPSPAASAVDPWDPLAEMGQMQREIDRMFRDSLGRGIGQTRLGLVDNPGLFDPTLDIKNTPESYLITMDVPGLDKSDLNIEVQGRDLIVSGERNQESEDQNPGQYYRKERQFGYFSRAILLPADAGSQVTIKDFKDGVLTLAVPKVKPAGQTMSKVNN